MLQAGQGDGQATRLEGIILNAHRQLVRSGPVFWIGFLGMCLILSIALGTSLLISNGRDRELNRSEKELESTVRLLSRQLDGQIQNFEAVPKSVANYLATNSNNPEEFDRLASSEAFYRYLRDKISDSLDFAGVNVFNANARFLNSSERWPVPALTISDRQFFQTFKSSPDSPSVLVQLVNSRISDGSTIVIARKVSSASGDFLGMVTRSISPDKFEALFSIIGLPDSELALFHRGGSLLARYPHFPDSLAKGLFESPLIEQASSAGYATVRLDSAVDEQERLASARSLEHYPIYIIATKMSSAVLEGWSRETRTMVLAAVLVTVIVGVMLIAVVRYLKEQLRRLDIAVSNMAQGLLLYDAAERLVLCNQRFLDMFELSPEIVKPGCKLRDIIQHRKDTGTLAGDVDDYCERVREGWRSGLITLSQIPDGRWIQIVTKPVEGGGWVATIEDVSEQHRNEELAVRLASHDTLTELPNRALLRSHLASELETCSLESQVAVLFLDMDEFKAVNDTLGHQVGDELLRSVARSLQTCAVQNEFVARLGGDEFAVVVSGISSEAQILTVVDRIYQAVRRLHHCRSHQLIADTSIGIAFAPTHGSTCDEILQNADLAMYDAKASGKRTYRIFEAQLEKKAKVRRQLEIDLRKALASKTIEVNYQPIVSLETDHIVGCEALARWRHPERGYVSPDEFIPIAEQSGLIEELGQYVLNLACMDAASWPNDIKVAVNVSPVQFKSGTFSLTVVAALSKSGLSPNRLELEITEAVLIGDDEIALSILHDLKAIGVRVALDDFGTGYSSLSYLRRFPFDKIKIDRSFINSLTDGDSSLSIVRAVVAMATEHKIVTTAEGVETIQQKEMLRDLGCAEMQGFLFSKARSNGEVSSMMVAAPETAELPLQVSSSYDGRGSLHCES